MQVATVKNFSSKDNSITWLTKQAASKTVDLESKGYSVTPAITVNDTTHWELQLLAIKDDNQETFSFAANRKEITIQK